MAYPDEDIFAPVIMLPSPLCLHVPVCLKFLIELKLTLQMQEKITCDDDRDGSYSNLILSIVISSAKIEPSR